MLSYCERSESADGGWSDLDVNFRICVCCSCVSSHLQSKCWNCTCVWPLTCVTIKTCPNLESSCSPVCAYLSITVSGSQKCVCVCLCLFSCLSFISWLLVAPERNAALRQLERQTGSVCAALSTSHAAALSVSAQMFCSSGRRTCCHCKLLTRVQDVCGPRSQRWGRPARATFYLKSSPQLHSDTLSLNVSSHFNSNQWKEE